MIPCPCCGRAIEAPTIDMIAEACDLTDQQRAILSHLYAAGTSMLTRQQIAEHIYGPPEGWPDYAISNVAVQIHKMRGRLEGSGYDIRHGSGPQHAPRGYRLVITERE